MSKFILTKKLGMTTIYKKDTADDVTLLEVGKNEIAGIRAKEKDGYDAVQVGMNPTTPKASKDAKAKETKTEKEGDKTGEEEGKVPTSPASFAKATEAKRATKGKKYEVVREFRVEDAGKFKKGDEMKIEQFAEGDKVTVKGICKGKGFQGVVKRHGFKGSPASHGHRHDLRAPGSIGSAFPEHVMKGKKMAGRMGNSSVTTKNMKVSLVDAEKGILAVKGAVPGRVGSIVEVYAK